MRLGVDKSSNIDDDPVMSPGVSCRLENITTNNQQESETMCDSKTDVSDGIEKEQIMSPTSTYSPENILMTNNQQESETICVTGVGGSSNIDEDPVMSPGVSCRLENITTNNQQESEPMCDSKTDVSDGIENEQIMSPTTTYSPANITLMNWPNDNVDKEPFKSTVMSCNTENVMLRNDQQNPETSDIDTNSSDINCNFSDTNAKSNLNITCLEESPILHTKKKDLVCPERIHRPDNILMTTNQQESITICEIGVGRSSNIDDDPVMSSGIACNSENITTNNQQESETICEIGVDRSSNIDEDPVMSPGISCNSENITTNNQQESVTICEIGVGRSSNIDDDPVMSPGIARGSENITTNNQQESDNIPNDSVKTLLSDFSDISDADMFVQPFATEQTSKLKNKRKLASSDSYIPPPKKQRFLKRCIQRKISEDEKKETSKRKSLQKPALISDIDLNIESHDSEMMWEIGVDRSSNIDEDHVMSPGISCRSEIIITNNQQESETMCDSKTDVSDGIEKEQIMSPTTTYSPENITITNSQNSETTDTINTNPSEILELIRKPISNIYQLQNSFEILDFEMSYSDEIPIIHRSSYRKPLRTESFIPVSNNNQQESSTNCAIEVSISDNIEKHPFMSTVTPCCPENVILQNDHQDPETSDIDINSSDINCNFSDINTKSNLDVTCLEETPILHTKKKDLVCPEQIHDPENILMTTNQQESITICEIGVDRSSSIDEDPVMSPGIACNSENITTNNQQDSETICEIGVGRSSNIDDDPVMSPGIACRSENITTNNQQESEMMCEIGVGRSSNIDDDPVMSPGISCRSENIITNNQQESETICEIGVGRSSNIYDDPVMSPGISCRSENIITNNQQDSEMMCEIETDVSDGIEEEQIMSPTTTYNPENITITNLPNDKVDKEPFKSTVMPCNRENVILQTDQQNLETSDIDTNFNDIDFNSSSMSELIVELKSTTTSELYDNTDYSGTALCDTKTVVSDRHEKERIISPRIPENAIIMDQENSDNAYDIDIDPDDVDTNPSEIFEVIKKPAFSSSVYQHENSFEGLSFDMKYSEQIPIVLRSNYRKSFRLKKCIPMPNNQQESGTISDMDVDVSDNIDKKDFISSRLRFISSRLRCNSKNVIPINLQQEAVANTKKGPAHFLSSGTPCSVVLTNLQHGACDDVLNSVEKRPENIRCSPENDRFIFNQQESETHDIDPNSTDMPKVIEKPKNTVLSDSSDNLNCFEIFNFENICSDKIINNSPSQSNCKISNENSSSYVTPELNDDDVDIYSSDGEDIVDTQQVKNHQHVIHTTSNKTEYNNNIEITRNVDKRDDNIKFCREMCSGIDSEKITLEETDSNEHYFVNIPFKASENSVQDIDILESENSSLKICPISISEGMAIRTTRMIVIDENETIPSAFMYVDEQNLSEDSNSQVSDLVYVRKPIISESQDILTEQSDDALTDYLVHTSEGEITLENDIPETLKTKTLREAETGSGDESEINESSAKTKTAVSYKQLSLHESLIGLLRSTCIGILKKQGVHDMQELSTNFDCQDSESNTSSSVMTDDSHGNEKFKELSEHLVEKIDFRDVDLGGATAVDSFSSIDNQTAKGMSEIQLEHCKELKDGTETFNKNGKTPKLNVGATTVNDFSSINNQTAAKGLSEIPLEHCKELNDDTETLNQNCKTPKLNVAKGRFRYSHWKRHEHKRK